MERQCIEVEISWEAWGLNMKSLRTKILEEAIKRGRRAKWSLSAPEIRNRQKIARRASFRLKHVAVS